MSTDQNLLAHCGLYCGACSFKVAYLTNDRQHLYRLPTKYDKLKDLPMEDCPGCRSENHCGPCPMRDCSISRGLLHCAKCADFPCALIQRFSEDGVSHHAEGVKNLHHLREIGEQAWLAEQIKNWTCSCGGKYSWYQAECTQCGSQKPGSGN